MLLSFIKNHLVNYPTPFNITYFWSFGFLAGFMLVNQILTGLFLAMYYMNNINLAFDSVEFIMRNVNFGWFIRYLHSNGASFFFIILYLHIGKGLYYRSFAYPRQNIWYSGMLIFILVMGTSFLGYVLPWGQMSFWGATVITSLVTVIPVIGENIVNWIWGGYSVGNPTLMRFFVIHYLLPFIILALVCGHILLLHSVGSSNPINIEKNNEKITFYPYFYYKDFFLLLILLIAFIYVVCYIPNFFNHADNYIKANPMSTPKHIVPEWYFLPFYAILRAISDKSIGIILFVISLGIFFMLPILAKFELIKFKNIVESNELVFIEDFTGLLFCINYLKNNEIDIKYIYIYEDFTGFYYNLKLYLLQKEVTDLIFRDMGGMFLRYINFLINKQIFWILAIIFIGLGYIGQLEVNCVSIELGQDLTLLYFLIIIMLALGSSYIFVIFYLILLFIIYIEGMFDNGLFGNIEIEPFKFL